MCRKYNIDGYINKVNKITKIRPKIALTTDVIVGFPGESEEEFLETYNFIKKVNFAELHVFPFSAREGTRAYDMPDKVDPKIKAERVDALIRLSKELQCKYIEQFKGEELEVILEERNKQTGLLSGFTSNYIKLEADLPDEYIGKIHKIKVR
jgi:threonylcarbamoyladenosine tRNA methylthiotransferase MtaB